MIMSKPETSDCQFPPDVPFMIRLLNEATGTNLRVNRHKVFRPVYTVYHDFDRTTEDAANFLVTKIRHNESVFFNEITWKSILALLQTKQEFRMKYSAVNIAIGWLIENPDDSGILNTMLMSICLPLTPTKLVEIRLGIHIYLTTELRDFFIIRLSSNGYIYITNKTDIAWKDLPYTVIDVCRNINTITDKYQNATWPRGLDRYDPELPRWKKGKYHQPPPVKSYKELKNPVYKWNFDPNDFRPESPKPTDTSTSEPHIFRAFSQTTTVVTKIEKVRKDVAVAKWLEATPSSSSPDTAPGSPPQPEQITLVKSSGDPKEEKKKKFAVTNSIVSSGYQSLESSKTATKTSHDKNSDSQKTSVTKNASGRNTNRVDGGKSGNREQSVMQLEAKQQENERLHKDKVRKGRKKRNEIDHNRRIPVNHRRLHVSVPRQQETSKKENNKIDQNHSQIKPKSNTIDSEKKNQSYSQNKPQYPVKDFAKNDRRSSHNNQKYPQVNLVRKTLSIIEDEEPVKQQQGTMEVAEYLEMLKLSRKPPQPSGKNNPSKAPQKPKPKFYFDTKSNVLEMNPD